MSTDATPRVEQIPDPCGLELERIWDEETQKNLLEAALARVKCKVNPKHLQIFDQYVLKGKSAREVAQIFQVKIPVVHLAKYRVSKKLKRELEDLKSIL